MTWWYSDIRILELWNYFGIHSAYQFLRFIIVFLLLSVGLLLFSAFLLVFCLNVLTGLLSLEHLLNWFLKTHENPSGPQSLSWLKREKSSRNPRSVIFNENVQQSGHELYPQVIVSEDQGHNVTERFTAKG